MSFDSETKLASETAGERQRVVELVGFDYDRNNTPEKRRYTASARLRRRRHDRGRGAGRAHHRGRATASRDHEYRARPQIPRELGGRARQRVLDRRRRGIGMRRRKTTERSLLPQVGLGSTSPMASKRARLSALRDAAE